MTIQNRKDKTHDIDKATMQKITCTHRDGNYRKTIRSDCEKWYTYFKI